MKADECVGDVTQPSHYCVPLASVLGRCQLRSADANKLSTSRTLTSTLGPRSLSVSGPASWNALPARLRHPDLTLESFRRLLKTALLIDWSIATRCRDSSCYMLRVKIPVIVNLIVTDGVMAA